MDNNASDRELLELVLAQVSKLTTDMDGVKSEIKGIKSEIKGIKSEVKEIKSEVGEVKKTVVKIEHEHGDINRTAINWTESKQKYQNTRKLYCGV